ncbi:MAG: hypothetical protein REI45_14165, partial [Propionicimonas sp.]|nr:hypothetical protein [Propionicimonas sp.]
THVVRNLAGETMTFDGDGLLVGQVDERGQGLHLDRVDGRIATITDALGQSLTLTWDGTGAAARVTAATSSDGRSVGYAYDTVAGERRLVGVTDVTGATTTYGYTAEGWLTDVTDPLGNVSAQNVYDADGRVVEQRDAAGALTTFSWDPATETAVVTDPTGRTRTDVYSGLNLVRQIDGGGAVTEQLYDGNNNQAASVDAADRLFREDFDDRNRLVRRVSPAPLFVLETWTYDDADRVTSHTESGDYGIDAVTTYAYDAAGQLSEVTSADGGVTRLTYTTGPGGVPAGLLASTTDPLDRTTTYAYDAAGNRISTTAPGGGTSSATYDAAHRPTSRTSPSGATTTSTYDAAGRLLTTTDPTKEKTLLFSAKANAGAGAVQPITGGIGVATDPKTRKRWVFFGTGRFLTTSDAADKTANAQGMYGIIDEGAQVAYADLQARSLTGTGTTRTADTKAALTSGKKGWYIPLPGAGERIVQDTQVVSNVLITASMLPSGTGCDSSGTGYVNAVDAFTGTSTGQSFFDTNGDGVVNASDTVAGSMNYGVGMPTAPLIFPGRLVVGGTGGSSGGGAGAPGGGPNQRSTWIRVSWRETRQD